MLRITSLIVIAGLAGCTAVETPSVLSGPGSAVTTAQLPKTVIPQGYTIDLSIVPDRATFQGRVTIDLAINTTLDRFRLHGKGLSVYETRLVLADGSVIPAQYQEIDEYGAAEILLSETVTAQQARLSLAYDASFGERLKGLYRVRDGEHWYAYTQFEPVSAREAFPCFDEPAFKVPFDITLNVLPGHTAISAMPERETIPLENGLQRVSFERSPPLPTYLIAFVVGPLDVVVGEPVPASRIRPQALPLRAVATNGKGPGLQFALSTTPGLLATLEQYFDAPHPYPKLDLIAVPDFSSGAMENVGAITYRESLLLLAEDAPLQQRRRHALVHAHEMAHQWFGNSVTMPWWDDIWLNEAFASWMAYRTVAEWNPAHRAELSRLQRLAGAMREDALASARQIRQPVLSHHDIENAFDSITYSKGGAVLSMLERYMGETAFRDAIRNHLRRYANANADADDFTASLSAIGGEPVAVAMRSFLYQPGIPLLAMERDCTTQPSLIISQSRYRPIGSEADPDLRWTVPVCVRYDADGGAREQCAMLSGQTASMMLETESCPEWLIPNAGFAGYYHWLMPVADYAGLIDEEKQLSAVEQMSIADSLYAALAAGRMSLADAATLFEKLAASARPQVALSPTAFIHETNQHLAHVSGTRAGLVRYVESLYGNLPAADAFNPESMAALPNDSRRLFLMEVAELMAWTGDSAARGAASLRAAKWLDGERDALPPESLELALRIAANDRGPAFTDRLIEQLASSRDGLERAMLIRVLARAADPALAVRMRDLTLTKTIRLNEVRVFFNAHLKEAAHRDASWTWLKRHFDELTSRLATRDAGRLPATIARSLCDESRVAEVDAFLSPRMTAFTGGPRNVLKALETIRLCARRVDVHQSQADAWFQAY